MLRLSEFLPYRLSVASNAVSERVAGVYQARFGLKVPECRVLAVVAEKGTATQAALVAATQMDKMTVSRAATALVARGLLARSSAEDRRTLELRLTAAGEALHAEIAPMATAPRENPSTAKIASGPNPNTATSTPASANSCARQE